MCWKEPATNSSPTMKVSNPDHGPSNSRQVKNIAESGGGKLAAVAKPNSAIGALVKQHKGMEGVSISCLLNPRSVVPEYYVIPNKTSGIFKGQEQ